MDDIWTRQSETLRRKNVGKSIVYLERYRAGTETRYYIEANGPDYRVWKRTPSENRAIEIYQRYRFWVWFIEAFNTFPTTRFITWIMHKTI